MQGVLTPPAITALSPSPRTNQTGTIAAGHWDRLEKAFPSCSPPRTCLAPAASPTRLPCVLRRMLAGGPSRSGTHVGWGPYPVSIFDPTVCVLCSTSSSDRWL